MEQLGKDKVSRRERLVEKRVGEEKEKRHLIQTSDADDDENNRCDDYEALKSKRGFGRKMEDHRTLDLRPCRPESEVQAILHQRWPQNSPLSLLAYTWISI